MWKRRSSVILSSKSRRRVSTPSRERKRSNMSDLLPRRVQGCSNRGRQAIPAGCLFTQAATSCGGQAVVLCPAVVLALTPLGHDENLMLQPVERRIQGSLRDVQGLD